MDAQVTTAQKTLTHRETLFVILGVLLPVFMASLDQTELAAALPTVGRTFNDVQNLPWLITTYLITMTASTPLYGKIADIRGRKFTILLALCFYLLGSLVCTIAPNMTVLILGRALHGLGGGGMQSTGMIVLGDVAEPRDRAKYYAYFSIVYTTAGGVGPLLGGFLAEHVHWRAIFGLNVPLGVIATVLTIICLRKLPRHERPHRLDIIGAVLIIVATVSFMLALNSGGVQHSWTSPAILTMLAVAIVVGALFLLRIATAPEPLIPLSIVADPVARWVIPTNVFGWGSIVGLNIFLPIYLQSAMGASPTDAGLSMMLFMIALNASAGLSAPIIGWVKHYKTVPMITLSITFCAVLALAARADSMTPLLFQILMFLIGAGFGPVAPLTTVALQNSVPSHQFGTAIGAMNFSRMLYTTIIVATFGAIVLSGTASNVAQTLGPSHTGGFSRVFYVAAASMLVSLFAMFMFEERPLRTAQS